MIEDLDLLANRVLQLVVLTQDLRAETHSLRQDIAQRDARIEHLQQALAEAQRRVADVLLRLPQAPVADDAASPDTLLPSTDADSGERSLHGTA